MSKIGKYINSVLWALAPGWQVKRRSAQVVKRFLERDLKAATDKSAYGGWVNTEQGPNADMMKLSTVRARANHAYWNDPYIRGAVDILINRSVGPGSTPQATTQSEEFNATAEALFSQWTEYADAHFQYHFGDMERLAVLKLFLDGGIFFKRVVDNRRSNPFCLEALEYSRLATDVAGNGANPVTYGIEQDKATGQVVAYHFYATNPDSPTSIGTWKARRIPSAQVIHFSPFRRPGQLLGTPLLAPALPYAYQLAELLEAELITKKIEACFGIAIKSTDLYTRYAAAEEDSDSEERDIEIAPGMVEHLLPGEEIEVIDPKRPGSNFDKFFKIIVQGMARSMGLSYEQISGDKSEVNYSSARHSELELRDNLDVLVKAVERYFLRIVWKDFIRYSIAAGKLQAPGFVLDPSRWFKHVWLPKGHDWVDPEKEAKAKARELTMGLSTLAEICAARGKDWKDVAKQRAKEKEFLNSLGLIDITQMQIKEMDYGDQEEPEGHQPRPFAYKGGQG